MKTTPEKVCPLCGQEFNKNGYGFGGLDAHWRANHEDFIPYDKARLLILDKPRRT